METTWCARLVLYTMYTHIYAVAHMHSHRRDAMQKILCVFTCVRATPLSVNAGERATHGQTPAAPALHQLLAPGPELNAPSEQTCQKTKKEVEVCGLGAEASRTPHGRQLKLTSDRNHSNVLPARMTRGLCGRTRLNLGPLEPESELALTSVADVPPGL